AERALVAVFAEEHDRAVEVRIHELRHGQEQRRRERDSIHETTATQAQREPDDDNARATVRKSSMNRFVSRCRVSSSGARNSDEGCTVARTNGASGDGMNSPRCAVTLN